MDLGVISLSDIQTNPATGRPHSYQQRIDDIVGYATLADRTGLDVFALGEHHTLDFAVSSPPSCSRPRRCGPAASGSPAG